MAVVAVLLNSKLYVANVGEPPACRRVGALARTRPVGVLWAACFPDT